MREGGGEERVVAVLLEVAERKGEFVGQGAKKAVVFLLFADVPGAEDEEVGADEEFGDVSGGEVGGFTLPKTT